MEVRQHSQRWNRHLPEEEDEEESHRRSFPCPSKVKDETSKTDGGRPPKNVSMAATSRYLTDRGYIMRKPLCGAEVHTSILKKTYPMKHTEKGKQWGVTRAEEHQQQHSDMDLLTRARAEPTPDRFGPSHSGVSSNSASRENLSSPLTFSELRTRAPREDSESPLCRSAQWRLSSSFLEVQRLNPPLRPPLTSTVLHPTYTPHSRYMKPGRAERRLCSSAGCSEDHSASLYQTNYWACAIPEALPPSQDRHSAGWDPNREYEALLDYTYPLRSGQPGAEWTSSLLQTDPSLQDSGIEVDQLYKSTSMSGLDLTASPTWQPESRSPLSVFHSRSPEKTSAASSGGLLSQAEPVWVSWDRKNGGVNHSRGCGHLRQHNAVSSSSRSSALICSTSVLPQSRCVCEDVDEEFWPLPEQLELQMLCRQVREVTDQLSRTVTASCDSLSPSTTSILSSLNQSEREEREDKVEQNESSREEISAAQTDSGAGRRSPGRRAEPVGEGLKWFGVKEVEAAVQQVCGLSLNSQQSPEHSDSLLQQVKVFCSHLEQFIQQLYAISENMELLVSPIVDIESLRLSLAKYQSFQREVSSHQPLMMSVLRTGQLLLRCIDTTSPFLSDALLLIERQSEALQTHAERFYSSILSATDSLMQHRPVDHITDQ